VTRAALARALVLALALAGTWGLPGRAHAYLDGAMFTEPAISGGSGGRTFSGAPADGYTCAVCHQGGGTFDPDVLGVPDDGYRPGETYELSIALPSTARNVGAILEVADEEGRGVGTLAPVPDADLEPADACRTGEPAVVRVAAPGRQLARLEVCGARRARVRWTAPASPVASVRLFASLVVSDDSGDPSGDTTAHIAQPLRGLGGAELEGGRLSASCAAAPTRAGGGAAAAALALVLLAATARAPRARTRRARSAPRRTGGR
jgi:hypothetical protein